MPTFALYLIYRLLFPARLARLGPALGASFDSMRSFKSLNNLVGWLVFAVAAVTYLLTLEPTASFWDCGEFIACSYKLLVPHPPGAPTFLLLGRDRKSVV